MKKNTLLFIATSLIFILLTACNSSKDETSEETVNPRQYGSFNP